MDDDAFYDPADIARRDAQQQLEQSRRDLAERQERDAENPDVLNAECDAFLAQRRIQEQEQLRRAAVAGIERDLATRQITSTVENTAPVNTPRQPPVQRPDGWDEAWDDPRPATMGIIYMLTNTIGAETGKNEKEIRNWTEEQIGSRILNCERKILQRVRELEKQPSAVVQQLLDRINTLEARLAAVEAKETFGGKHAKRIITSRDKSGQLVADIYEPVDDDKGIEFNGHGHA